MNFTVTPAMRTPEGRLICAIIDQALADMINRRQVTREDRESAKIFLNGPDLDFYCGLIDINPEWVRTRMQDHIPLAIKLAGK